MSSFTPGFKPQMPFDEANPEQVGMSSDVLGKIAKDSRERIESGEHVGTVSLVGRKGKIVYFQAIGMQDREAGIPMQRDTIFRVYSNTKLITGVAAMMLFDAGKFGLDDPVSRFLPEFKDMQVGIEEGEGDNRRLRLVPAQREITIRHLLTHTAGISYGWDNNSLVERIYQEKGVLYKSHTIAEMVRKLGETPLKHQPGTAWQYGLSFDVLGRLVEVVSGMDYDKFLRRHIFDPLGMPDTGFHVPAENVHRLAADYQRGENNRAEKMPPRDMSSPYPNEKFDFTNPTTFFGGGGHLVSTALDHACFCQMLLNLGEFRGNRILRPETVDLMLRNHFPAGAEPPKDDKGQEQKDWAFGLGFRLKVPDDGKPGWNCGWGGMAGTSVWIDTVNQLMGIYMIQIHHHDAANRFSQIVYESLTSRP